MAYFDIKIQETAKASQKILEYVHQVGSKIEKIQDIIHKLQGSDDSFEAIIECLRNKEEEMSKQRNQMYALKLVLDQVITQYQQTEESLIVTEETNLEKFNKVMTGITYRGMALGEGAIDVAAEAVEGAWKLLLEPPMRMGKQFIDWNANCLGIMSDEEYNKNTETFNTYADEWNSSVINGVVNVFNFKDLEQNTILSPFAKCWNNFGSYMSEDATYEDMVAYSKDIWNSVITIGAVKGAGSAVKGKIRGLKTGTGTLAEVVEEESVIKSGSASKYLEQLDNLSENKINHMINGSKNSNHGWEKLVPDKNWSDIKNIIADVMDTGVEGPYKSVFSKKATINGFEVEVTYTKLSDGTIKISDAWVNQ